MLRRASSTSSSYDATLSSSPACVWFGARARVPRLTIPTSSDSFSETGTETPVGKGGTFSPRRTRASVFHVSIPTSPDSSSETGTGKGEPSPRRTRTRVRVPRLKTDKLGFVFRYDDGDRGRKGEPSPYVAVCRVARRVHIIVACCCY
jgi:hypothetical protein